MRLLKSNLRKADREPEMKHWSSRDWVRFVLALSVGLVMLGIVLAVILHGRNFVYSEVSIAALAGVLGAMVNGLLNSRKDCEEESDE